MGLTQKLGTIPLAIQTDSSNNVGIGGAANASYKLAVTGASLFSSSVTATSGTTGAAIKLTGFTNYGTIQDANDVRRIWFENTGSYRTIFDLPASGTSFDWRKNDGTTLMVVKSTGNVGIGTGNVAAISTNYGTLNINGTNGGGIICKVNDTSKGYFYSASEGTYIIDSSSPIFMYTNGSERMRITSGGQIFINNATNFGSTYAFLFKGVTGLDNFAAVGVRTNGDNIINWFNASNTYVASIVINASSVSYGTGSDYRLKEDLKDFNGLEKVSAIKVYDFKFKEEGDRMEGVLAHELQEVIPYAVSGVKDELDADGNAKIQNVDYSKIVPVLIKAIQELSAKVTALENK